MLFEFLYLIKYDKLINLNCIFYVHCLSQWLTEQKMVFTINSLKSNKITKNYKFNLQSLYQRKQNSILDNLKQKVQGVLFEIRL